MVVLVAVVETVDNKVVVVMVAKKEVVMGVTKEVDLEEEMVVDLVVMGEGVSLQ